jgi:hypothetical protein
MKAIKLSAGVLVLMALIAALTALPAMAQSRWDSQVPAVLGLAKDGMLVTAAPPGFTGCTEGTQGDWVEGWPDVDLFSFFVYTPEDPAAPMWRSHWVWTSSGRGNWSFEGDTLIRVFMLGAGDLDWYENDPCGFYGTHPYIAEGLGRMNHRSPDDLLVGPGTNSWGWVLKGDLDNDGTCPAGQRPSIVWLQNWITHSPDPSTAKTTAQMGPTLTCKK